MKVQVRLFATLRRRLPVAAAGATSDAPVSVELPDGATVAELLDHLGIAVPDAWRAPDPGATQPQPPALLVLVNGRHADRDARLGPGDTVSLFPAMGGG